MLRLSAKEARSIQKNNTCNTWSSRNFESNSQETRHASNRLWREKIDIGIKPKFSVSPLEKVFAIGSCFAREIEDALFESGLEVPTYCDHIFEHPLLKHPNKGKIAAAGQRPRSFVNRYNTMSLLQEFRHLLGVDSALINGQLVYQINDQAAADLHYSQSLPQVSRKETVQRRSVVREYLSREIRHCSIFIITLGLAEAWYDSVEGKYLNNTPGPRVVGVYGDRLEIHLTTFRQHLEALGQLHELLSRELNHDFKIVLTVSPVPLEKTFFDQDVITTNTYSKSMLRAVAHEFAVNHCNVDYFPSYEIATYSQVDETWAWDLRHVKPSLVRHITDTFLHHYLVK